MQIKSDLRPQLYRALAAAGEVVNQVSPADLTRPTPCAGWDLTALLTHMVGQNDGFAVAVATGDAPESAYLRPALTADEVDRQWRRSATRLAAAFTHADPDRRIRLREVSPDSSFPMAVVVGMQLLDTVIHSWDVATAIGQPHQPEDELVNLVSAIADQVPTGASRDRPGAAFAAELVLDQRDPWLSTLAQLGRPAPSFAPPCR